MSPYVMLKFGPTLQKKTQICYSAGQNPVWENQKFEFSRVEENSLTFTVHDRDESGVDHLIGEVRLSLVDDENLSDSGGDQRMKESLKNGVVLLGSSGRKIKYSFGCGKSGLSTGSLGVSLKWWPE
jgi:Ca2+-dependent lipid-binding protein